MGTPVKIPSCLLNIPHTPRHAPSEAHDPPAQPAKRRPWALALTATLLGLWIGLLLVLAIGST